VSNSLKCPICGREFQGKPLETWKFRYYNVKRFECAHCGMRFNLYESPKSKFTIPKRKHWINGNNL